MYSEIALQEVQQRTIAVGTLTNGHTQLLGSGFFLKNEYYATALHAVKNLPNLKVIPAPNVNSSGYQNFTDRSHVFDAVIHSVNPLIDIAILKVAGAFSNQNPSFGLAGLDYLRSPAALLLSGYPHCVMGRFVHTFKDTVLGAKIERLYFGTPVRQGVLNIMTRPGESGSMVVDMKNRNVVGMLVGAWVPQGSEGAVTIGGIDPQTLHATSLCVSLHHITELL